MATASIYSVEQHFFEVILRQCCSEQSFPDVSLVIVLFYSLLSEFSNEREIFGSSSLACP